MVEFITQISISKNQFGINRLATCCHDNDTKWQLKQNIGGCCETLPNFYARMQL